MQDRSRQIGKVLLQRTAGPYIRVKRVGSAVSACRLHPQLRTYGCDAANRRFGPEGDISVIANVPLLGFATILNPLRLKLGLWKRPRCKNVD
jgi:hypothetical protein